ncbi:SRPBCC domain-containing protein [Nocardia jiangxiensis]|uniref:SRPBCC domain-containing protein n=1 Tax=Nocardia jiangxiensis TaxID=282685 RepID=UPI0002DF9E33|nr:SRPBCC domain-containing protein [Nocardia jiangxiensis]
MSTQSYRPSPLHPVELVDAGGQWSLVFTRDFPHPPEAVWSALTDPGELAEWAPYTADRSLAALGPVTLIMIDGETKLELPGEVSQVDRPRLLEYTWSGEILRWEITETTGGTTLRLTHHLSDRAQAAMMAAGWHLCLDVAALLLAGTPIGPIVGADAMNNGWSELNRAYSAELGVEPIEPPLSGDAGR